MSEENILIPEHSPGGKRPGISLSADIVTQSTEWMTQEQQDLVRWLFRWIKESRLEWNDLKKQTGFDPSTLYKLFNDKYRDENNNRVDVSKLCERIKRFREIATERGNHETGHFVETSVFTRIEAFCREALVTQSVAIIYGESHIGKTESLKEVIRRKNYGQAAYVLCPSAGGKHELVQETAQACGITARCSVADLRARVQRFLNPTTLLIFDEVHEFNATYQQTATLRCLGMIRQWYEKSQCGIVLCATNDFRDTMEKGEFAQTLKQLRRRGIWELQLEDVPSKEDLSLIAASYKLEPPTGDVAKQVNAIARESGFGKYCRFLKRAEQKAAKDKQPMQWKHFMAIVGAAADFKTKPNSKL